MKQIAYSKFVIHFEMKQNIFPSQNVAVVILFPSHRSSDS